MIRINLLPFRAARKKENIRRQISIFLLSIVLVFILVIWWNFRLSGKIESLNKKIKETEIQVAKYNKINKEISEIKEKLATLNKKIDVIKSLDLNRKAPVQTLDNISKLMVEKRMWLTMLEENDSRLKANGISLDNQTIADFMTRLETSGKYTEVRLVSIRQESSLGENLNLKRFDLTFKKATQDEGGGKAKGK